MVSSRDGLRVAHKMLRPVAVIFVSPFSLMYSAAMIFSKKGRTFVKMFGLCLLGTVLAITSFDSRSTLMCSQLVRFTTPLPCKDTPRETKTPTRGTAGRPCKPCVTWPTLRLVVVEFWIMAVDKASYVNTFWSIAETTKKCNGWALMPRNGATIHGKMYPKGKPHFSICKQSRHTIKYPN